MDPNKKVGTDLPAQQEQELEKWLEDLDKELDTLEEEQKERWKVDDTPHTC